MEFSRRRRPLLRECAKDDSVDTAKFDRIRRIPRAVAIQEGRSDNSRSPQSPVKPSHPRERRAGVVNVGPILRGTRDKETR